MDLAEELRRMARPDLHARVYRNLRALNVARSHRHLAPALPALETHYRASVAECKRRNLALGGQLALFPHLSET